MHKMIPRSSSTNKWLQSGMLLSPRRSFLHLCFAETCRCTTVPPRQFRQSSFQHQVYRARKKLCAQQLKGFNLDDSYGKLQEFADCHLWSTVVRTGRHNDPEDGWPPRLLRNQPPERGGIRCLAFQPVVFVDAHSRLPSHQSRLGVSALRGCHWQAVSEER